MMYKVVESNSLHYPAGTDISSHELWNIIGKNGVLPEGWTTIE